MQVGHVEAFVAIVRLGSFTRAAATLHLSQPAISRRVHLLEHELGAPLLERTRPGVVLTDAGRAFLPHAAALLATMRDGLDAVAALRGATRGTVMLAVVGTLAGTRLTERLRTFHEAHPMIDLQIRIAPSAEVSDLVRRGDATLGLRYGGDPDPELVSLKIHDEPMVPVSSSRHRLARARRVETGALANEKWVAFPPHAGAGRDFHTSTLARTLAAAGIDPSNIVPIDSLLAQKRMVEAGFGLALLPASSIDEELRAGTLHALGVPALRMTVAVVLIHRRRGFQSGATRALVSLLTEWG